MAEITLRIPDMTCAHCEKRIRDAVEDAGGSVVSLDLGRKTVVIKTATPPQGLLSAIDGAGYDAEII